MVAEQAQRGAAVEAAARALLEQAGLRWRAANVRFRGGELDLVMHDPGSNCLVFVEVRYRRDSRFGPLKHIDVPFSNFDCRIIYNGYFLILHRFS